MQIPFNERACSSEPLLMAVSPIKQISFCVRFFGVNSLLFCIFFFVYRRLVLRPIQENLYKQIHTKGCSLEIPLRSAFTLGFWPAGRPSIGSCRLEMADLWLFKVLYAFFVSNKWAR